MSGATVAARSARAVLWSVAGALGKILGQLLIQITLARLLGPQAFGEFAAVMFILSLCYLISDAGFGSALIQKRDISNDDIQVVLGWSLVIAVIVAACIELLAPPLANVFGDPAMEPMFRICGLLVLLQPLISLPLNLMRRDLNFKILQIIHLVAYTLVYGTVAIALALMGWGGWSLVIAHFCQSLFVLIAVRFAHRTPFQPRLNGNSELIRFGLKSMLSDMANWSLDYLDQFLIGRFWTIRSLGLYAASMNLCKAPTGLIANSLQKIAFASAARLQDNLATLRNGYSGVLAAMGLVTLPLFALASQQADVILRIIYGDKWTDAAPVLATLALAMPAVTMGTVTASILRGTGAVALELRIQAFSVFILATALFAMADQPLSIAVIAVPIIYWCRLALLMLAIVRRLELHPIDMFVALRGGTVLAVIGVATGAMLQADFSSSEHLLGSLPLFGSCSAVLIFALIGRYWLISRPLADILISHFSSGRLGFLVAIVAGARR